MSDDGEDPVEWQAPWEMDDFDEGAYRFEGSTVLDGCDSPVSSAWWEWPGPMGGTYGER